MDRMILNWTIICAIVFLSTFLGTASAEPVVALNFDDGLNCVKEGGGHNWDLSFEGEPNFINHDTGQAMQLSGKEWLIVPPHPSLDFTDTMTVLVWFRVGRFDKTYQALIAKGEVSWRLSRSQQSNTLHFGTGARGSYVLLDGKTPVDDGLWHHVAVTVNRENITMYLDGKLEAQTVTDKHPPMQIQKTPVLIGANPDIPGREWVGDIDDVMLFNEDLDQRTIETLMTFGPEVYFEPTNINNEANAQYYLMVANRFIGQGKYREAIQELEACLQKEYTMPIAVFRQKVLYLLGHAYLKVGQYSQAQACYWKLLMYGNQPSNEAKAQFYLGYAYALMGRQDLYQDTMEMLCESYPEDNYAAMARLCLHQIETPL